MRWLLVTDEFNSLSTQVLDLLQTTGQTVINYTFEKIFNKKQIENLIQHDKPDRIVLILTKNSQEKLKNHIHDYLIIPIFLAQLTCQKYSTIPLLILTVKNTNEDINILQNALDQLVNMHSHILNAKLFCPITDENITEDYFRSIWSSSPDEYHHVTILSDILPILLALAHDGKGQGQIDVCNKGPLSLNSFLKRSHKLSIDVQEDLPDRFEMMNKQMITPETRQLYQALYLLPPAWKTIEQILRQKSLQTIDHSSKILLVTGGCGFIGSTFINHWLETYPNDKIINIDRLDPVANVKNVINPQSSNYSFILADINNKDIVLHLCNQYNITHIVHFAVQAHLDTTFGNSITFTETNVYGTHSVLEASRIYGKIQKFLHISTDEVYGETPSGTNQEICLLNPINPYAATIAAAEFLVKSYGESFKLPYSIVRLCNVYGPRQHFEKIIPKFIGNLLDNEKVKIHGDGQQIRHYLYVDDVVRAIELIFLKGKPKMIYNIGTDNQFNVLDIVKYILKQLNIDKNIDDIVTFVKPRSFPEKRYCATTSSLVKSLGWNEQVSFEQGLEKTIQWFKANPNYWGK